MNMRIFLLCILWLNISSLTAQVPDYISNKFAFTVSKDINYGSTIAYDGTEKQLLLDIYKPQGDNNCKRPLLIIVHGGAWIAGTKEDPQIVEMSKQFASKGWVVASINYRLGMHTTNFYTPYLLCPANNPALCARVCDTSEVFRAIYRGMQDARGAIRFMKLRADVDSTDVNNAFVAGESAGAFISLFVAFLDQPNEKPLDCYNIADAPKSDIYLNYCHSKSNPDLSRPDLGDIQGDLNKSSANADVQGVGDIYGGMLDMSIIDNKKLPIYIFHQASDLLVHYKKGRLLGRLSECLNGICEPFYQMPLASGGYEIRKYFEDSGNGAKVSAEILENSTAADCTINPPGHSIDNIVLRTNNMAKLFAPVIFENGNDPVKSCTTSTVSETKGSGLKLFPNPGTYSFTIEGIDPEEIILEITLTTVLGSKLSCTYTRMPNGNIYIKTGNGILPGVYFCNITTPNFSFTKSWISNNY